MWPFKSKKWGKLGAEYPVAKLRQILVNGTGVDLIRLYDSKYRAIPKSDFVNLAWSGKNDNIDYESNSADCDDQALFYESDTRKQWAKKAKGSGCALAFGRALVIRKSGEVPHVMIWQVDDKGLINWFEGQNHAETKTPFKIFSIEG